MADTITLHASDSTTVVTLADGEPITSPAEVRPGSPVAIQLAELGWKTKRTTPKKGD